LPVCDREITVADLPVDWRLDFEERAAIREFDGGKHGNVPKLKPCGK
jgi:hypothetical protein